MISLLNEDYVPGAEKIFVKSAVLKYNDYKMFPNKLKRIYLSVFGGCNCVHKYLPDGRQAFQRQLFYAA